VCTPVFHCRLSSENLYAPRQMANQRTGDAGGGFRIADRSGVAFQVNLHCVEITFVAHGSWNTGSRHRCRRVCCNGCERTCGSSDCVQCEDGVRFPAGAGQTTVVLSVIPVFQQLFRFAHHTLEECQSTLRNIPGEKTSGMMPSGFQNITGERCV
jgi:hypothetical protein